MEFDCSSSAAAAAAAADSSTDMNTVMISVTDLKNETLLNDNLCDDDLASKDIAGDLTTLDNLEILHTCSDNVFANTNVMDCLSDLNNSPENFDIPTIDNDDAVLPMYGPYAEFESQSSYAGTDVMDAHAVPGVCGLRNLGNTCFMNAGLQCLLNNKIFKNNFYERDIETFLKGTLTFKFAEIMHKVWSGSYSTLHLGEFKECFGNMHIQFRNFRQHDCQEFLALLLDTMHEELNSANKMKFDSEMSCSHNIANNSEVPVNNKPVQADSGKEMETSDTKNGKSEQKLSDLVFNEAFDQSNVNYSLKSSDTTNAASAANNIKQINNTPGAVIKNVMESDSSIYERNTEKMADLLINNNKLDKILKNELDVIHNSKDETDCFSIMTAIKENHTELQNENENKLEKNELAYKLNTARKIPSIEDFVKDTKTLNTNVLVSDETNNLFKFDSEKFPKHEPSRLQETVDNLGQIVDFGTKQGGVKRVKITNIMHEKHKMFENNEQTSCSTLHKRLKIENMDTNLDSPVTEQDDAVDMEQTCDECSEGSSQSSELYALNSECRVLLFAEEIRRAYSHWDHYKSLNQSIIVDTFHGQFRSSVVCSQCSHNSITYEPFMYLPVFLPHALERQIVVTFVQNNGSPPVCYLVNVNKFDRVHKIREALQRLLDVPAEEIVIAEVAGNHIVKLLDENQSIRRIDDSTNSIYAFEVGKICELNSDVSKNSNAIPLGFCEENKDDENYSNNVHFFENISKCNEEFVKDSDSFKNSSPLDLKTNMALTDDSSSQLNIHEENMPKNLTSNFSGPVKWHSCAICLEDLPDYHLSLHPNCECILCSGCIEVSCKHYGGVTFICPVCSSSVSPAEDFVPLTRLRDYQFKISTIPISIVMRHDSFKDGMLEEKLLIGHPCLLKLPSTLPASKLYEHVDNAIPFLSTYSLLLVDSQGKRCSRCLCAEECHGCEIARTGDIKLLPGDNIAVRYVDLPPESVASANSAVEHKSMQQTRHKSELDIYDCLDYFSERESLDEDSPWYCPVCRRNQQATKSLSVWKFPEVLIICLKRFVFHDFVSMKVEDKVSYPLEGLDLSSFSSGPFSGDLIYDLQACVCHFGGVSAGHYTSYSKHAVTNEWYYYNDENVKKEKPNTDECINEYILFYQKR